MLQELMSTWAIRFDLPILDWIQANIANPVLDKIMPIITLFGDAGIFWIAVAVLLLFFKKYRRLGAGMGIALLLGVLICNVTMKPIFQRPRPYDFQEAEFGIIIELITDRMHDYSFPSGHTIASFEACTVLLLGNKKMGIPALLLAIAIAFSRLYLYVHYPTDVIVSMVLGTIFGIIGYFVAQKVNISLKGKYLAK